MHSSGATKPTTTRRSSRNVPSTSTAGEPSSSQLTGATTGRSRTAIGIDTASTATTGFNGSTNLKRKLRSTSVAIDEEPTTSKKPALNSAFSEHVTATSAQKQLLSAQSQVTELQNRLLAQQATVDKLEADRRLLASQADEQREGRVKAIEETAKLRETYSASLASLQKRFTELEGAHGDLSEEYEVLERNSRRQTSQISALEADISLLKRENFELAKERDQLKEKSKNWRSNVDEDDEDGSTFFNEGAIALSHPGREGTEELSATDSNQSMHSDSPSRSSDGSVFRQTHAKELEEDDSEHEIDEIDDGMDEEDNGMTLREGDDGSEDDDAEGEDDEDMSLTKPMDGYIRSSQAPSSPPHAREGFTQSKRDSNDGLNSGSPSSSAYYAGIDHVGPPNGAKKRRNRSTSKSPAPATLADRLVNPRPLASSITPSGTPSRSVLQHRTSTPLRGSPLNPQTDADRAIIRTELTKVTAHLRTLEMSNARLTGETARLRTRVEGTDILREKLREMERKVEGMEQLRLRVGELEESLDESLRTLELERRKNRDGMEMESLPNFSSSDPQTGIPITVAKQLAELRAAYARLLDEHGQTSASLRAQEAAAAEAHEEARKAADELILLRNSGLRVEEQNRMADREVRTKAKEIEFLKSLIASYKAEETMHNSEGSSSSTISSHAQETLKFEGLIEEYKSTITDLEAEIERIRKSPIASRMDNRTATQVDELVERAKEVQAQNEVLEQSLKEADTTIEDQETRIDTLEQQLFELKGEVGAGRHIPPGSRIVCLRENPAQKWADTREEILNRLKGENAALLSQLNELESLKGALTGHPQTSGEAFPKTVPRESYEGLKQEKEELDDKLKQKEKRLQRLTEVFTKKSAEFREAIASIMGLKLAFYPNGQVRVTSIYDLGASFVFQPDKSKDAGGGDTKMQLIGQGEGGPQELEQLMNYWVQQEMNIPCFLASVTLECYDKVRREEQAGM